jgi:transposase
MPEVAAPGVCGTERQQFENGPRLGAERSRHGTIHYVYERPARKHFRWWHGWAVRSRLQPMVETALMLKRRLENILTYLRHRITNAASESINSKIQWVKYTARGFRNKRNFQTAIYFHCGGLEMAP